MLDMARVRYVNSSGLGVLVREAEDLRAGGGGLALAGVATRVRIVIEMLGLEPFLPLYSDVAAGCLALGSNVALEVPDPEAVADPEPGSLYPRAARCRCGTRLELARPGRWRCPRCFAGLQATPDGVLRPLAYPGFASPGLVPVELTLGATPACGEGLLHLVTAVCRQVIGPQALHGLRLAVHEVCLAMTQRVYAASPGVFHVSIQAAPGRVLVRFADSGASLEPLGGAALFPHGARLGEFECRPHPTGVGNTIRLLQTDPAFAAAGPSPA